MSDWDHVAFVISSQYRVDTLCRLREGPATPTIVAKETDNHVTHISRALNELRGESFVELLVSEDVRKGRVYGLTDKGLDAWSLAEENDLVEAPDRRLFDM